MMEALANMIQHQQTQTQDVFATVMRAVGTEGQTGDKAPRGILGKDDLHWIKEFKGNGWEHWGCLFKCAVKDASIENYDSHGEGHIINLLGKCPISDRHERGIY